MALADLVDDARAVQTGPKEEWPFRIAAIGERLEIELAHPDQLTEVSQRIISIAEQAGCSELVGASPVGERLAAAAVALAGNGLRLFARDNAGERVLVVDGTLASGAQVARMARVAKGAGAKTTPAAVVLALNGTPAFLKDEIDELFVVLDS